MKIKNNIARQKNTNTFNLSKQTITTTDFGIKRPIMCNVMFPGEKFVINIDHLTRLMPLPNPTFGKIKETIRAFSVPYRTIHKYFNDILANNYIFDGEKKEPETHWIYMKEFCNLIWNNTNITTETNETNYDVAIDLPTFLVYDLKVKKSCLDKTVAHLHSEQHEVFRQGCGGHRL